MVSFWAVVAAFGIPSAFMGFVIWRLERKIEARDRAQEKKNQDQQKLFLLIVQGTRAATALGEATAMLCSAATRTVTWKGSRLCRRHQAQAEGVSGQAGNPSSVG